MMTTPSRPATGPGRWVSWGDDDGDPPTFADVVTDPYVPTGGRRTSYTAIRLLYRQTYLPVATFRTLTVG